MTASPASSPEVPALTRPVSLELNDVAKRYHVRRGQDVQALEGFSLRMEEREFVALLGPSGCGKSTALRLMAGLEEPDAGTVSIAGRAPRELAEAGELGAAFQEHALLPWLSVESNIALPFKIVGRPVDHAHVAGLIELVGLTGFEKARPKHLSGGMSQRVSIARSLALDPTVLLLDEPFGALDAVTRRRLNLELQRVWTERSITTLLVTHSVEEALFLADRVAVITSRPGRVQLVREVPFDRPRDRSIIHAPEFHALTEELTDALDSHVGEE
jgi:NitT/TauT family transport system ATP-binding protein